MGATAWLGRASGGRIPNHEPQAPEDPRLRLAASSGHLGSSRRRRLSTTSTFREDPSTDNPPTLDLDEMMKEPEKWSAGAYFILGMVIGAFGAFALLAKSPPVALWTQRLIAVAVPVAAGFLALLIREKIFWFLDLD